jgi:hypothetical protein
MSELSFGASSVFATAVQVVSTIFAAVAALAAGSAARTMERSRKQTTEPYLAISFPEPDFSFTWRPSTGEPPAIHPGHVWTAIPSQGCPELVISNHGGGPALDLQVFIERLGPPPTDDLIPEMFRRDVGGVHGASLQVVSSAIQCTGQHGRGGTAALFENQAAFVPVCGQGTPEPVLLRPELLLSALPRFMFYVGGHGYLPRSIPAEGRTRWQVTVRYRTALQQPAEPDRAFSRVIYADLRMTHLSESGDPQVKWYEVQFFCTLKVEPREGFSETPLPRSVQVSVGFGSAAQVEAVAAANVRDPAAEENWTNK